MLEMINNVSDDSRWYPFRVTIGLIEGYNATAKRHSLDEVKLIIGHWLRACKADGVPELPGMISEKTMLYTRRSDGELLEEPVAIFEGEVNPLRVTTEVPEAEYVRSLWSLADALADALNQTRIYIKFNQRTIVLERK